MSRDTVVLPDFIEAHHIGSVDFVKIDIDGRDFEILSSLNEVMDPLQILGFALEVNFIGSESLTDHSFHNTDRFMRSHGFDLFDLRSVRRYSGAALPLRYQSPDPGVSVGGRLMQGDALYIRDICSPSYVDWARRNLSTTKKLKIAILFSLFNLPDCAAEVINTFADELSLLVDLRLARELLATQAQNLSGISPEDHVSYDEYMEAFWRDEPVFYPDGMSPRRLKQWRDARWTPADQYDLPDDLCRLGVVHYGEGSHFLLQEDRCRFIPATPRDHIVSNYFEIPPGAGMVRITVEHGENVAEILHVQDPHECQLRHAGAHVVDRGVDLYFPIVNGTSELRLVIHADKNEIVLPRKINVSAGLAPNA